MRTCDEAVQAGQGQEARIGSSPVYALGYDVMTVMGVLCIQNKGTESGTAPSPITTLRLLFWRDSSPTNTPTPTTTSHPP